MCCAVLVLRVHFTAPDLHNTRFAAAPAPLLELSLAVAALRRSSRRTTSRPGVPERRTLPAAAMPVLSLVTAGGNGPRFLDPICADFSEGLELVRASPTSLVARELHRVVGRSRRLTPWHQDLIARDRDAWQTLTTAITTAHQALLEPNWSAVVRRLTEEVKLRAQIVTRQGLVSTLAGLYPGARWDGLTLAIPSSGEHDVHLNGAGLTATPSAYWLGGPLRTVHPNGSTVLIYPAATRRGPTAAGAQSDPLAELLGRTRAAALRVLVRPHTTSGLSAALGVSPAAASDHARVLRGNGLIGTTRAGKSVLHQCSPLGMTLLDRQR